MTTGTKAFRIIISTLLALTLLLSVAFAALFVLYIEAVVMEEEYGLSVLGVEVTRSNKDDILGDGSVYFNETYSILTFDNAEIEYDYSVVYSRIDLMIELVGENKFIMSGEYAPVIYASDYLVTKDLTFFGDGTLAIEFEGECSDAMGIHGKSVRIESDISLTMPSGGNIVNGIYCESSVTIANAATVTVNNGSGKYSSAVKAIGNVNVEGGATLDITSAAGTTDNLKGLNVGGSLVVWDNATVRVTVDDTIAECGECINVAGLLSVGRNASVSATSKKIYSVECYGSIELNEGAALTVSTEGDGTDLLCYGAIVNYGATVSGEVEALGGVHNK